ncbi:hypothetical protein [Mesorhizobium sp. B2-4-14]|uniref:hypothetical protein n=1 Tax=Mesorhizobium sp. B2-4-14 TaxID=2589935 RepID=UPI0015E44D74|nr:hypothetical protein [Mesorhizobium sp. B2-4-14]
MDGEPQFLWPPAGPFEPGSVAMDAHGQIIVAVDEVWLARIVPRAASVQRTSPNRGTSCQQLFRHRADDGDRLDLGNGRRNGRDFRD